MEFDDFWLRYEKKLPKLYEQAVKTNIILSTSVPAESAFSVAGYIQRKEKSSLSCKNLRFSFLTKQIDEVKYI